MNPIKSGDVIYIGDSFARKKAVVCQVYDDQNIEVVYLDRDRAINEDMVFEEGKWEFKIQGPNGGYADKYPRLSRYVRILRSGSG